MEPADPNKKEAAEKAGRTDCFVLFSLSLSYFFFLT